MSKYIYKFKNIWKGYFNHPSCGTNIHFQRLEFLGDKVLSFFLSNILFTKFPYMTEGMLTIALSNLVNQKILSEKAEKIKHYFTFKNTPNESILSDCFEVWIGAVFLDGGNVHKILLHLFKDDFLDIIVTKDPKNTLQEISQKYNKIPHYSYVYENNIFTCIVSIDKYIATGHGVSKKQSSRHAASQWLEKFKNIKI